MTCTHVFALILTTFAIRWSQQAVILSPMPVPTLSPQAAYALRSSFQDQPYSHSSSDSNARISNLQLLSPIILQDLMNKKSKQRHADRAMFYEPMLPLVEKDVYHQPPPYHHGEPDDSKETPKLNLVMRYEDDDDDDDDGHDRQRKNYQIMSDESSESSSESIEQRLLPIKNRVSIQKPSAITSKNQLLCPICAGDFIKKNFKQQHKGRLYEPMLPLVERQYPISSYSIEKNDNSLEKPKLDLPGALISKNPLLCPICAADFIKKNSKQQHNGRIYEPMLPLVERESPMYSSSYSIENYDDSEEKPKLDLLLQYYDDDYEADSRHGKNHRTSVESFESESESSETAFGAVKRSISIQPKENHTEEISDKLKTVCAHFPLNGARLDDDESKAKTLVVPGLMSILCKMLLSETGYPSHRGQDLEL